MILVYKNIAPHENLYSATNSDDRKKNAKNKCSIRMFVGVKNEGYLC